MGLFSKLKKNKEKQIYTVSTVVNGEVIDIKETKDELFNTESLGKGVGIIASSNEIVAPEDGVISSFFPTKHAVGITTNQGVEILIHIGIDTVELDGKYFDAKKEQGQSVRKGEVLVHVDFEKITEAGYDPTVMVVVTNTSNYENVEVLKGMKSIGEDILKVQL